MKKKLHPSTSKIYFLLIKDEGEVASFCRARWICSPSIPLYPSSLPPNQINGFHISLVLSILPPLPPPNQTHPKLHPRYKNEERE